MKTKQSNFLIGILYQNLDYRASIYKRLNFVPWESFCECSNSQIDPVLFAPNYARQERLLKIPFILLKAHFQNMTQWFLLYAGSYYANLKQLENACNLVSIYMSVQVKWQWMQLNFHMPKPCSSLRGSY